MSELRPLIIGVSGGSGSGKTTFTRELVRALGTRSDGKPRAAVIAQDSYYIDQSHRFTGDGESVNFDHPSSIEFSLIAEHLKALRAGQSVQVPRYDFASHTRSKTSDIVESAPVIIVDGILIFSQPVVCAELDYLVFIDTQESVRFARRLKRDTTERGRTPEGVQKQFDRQVKPMHDQFVEPSKAHANHVCSGESSFEPEIQKVVEWIESHLKK